MKRVGLFLPLAALCACSPRVLAIRSIAPAIQRGSSAFYEETDPQLAADAMPAQLKLTEVLLKNDPEDEHLLAAAAEGFGAYAFLFLEDTQPDRARQAYLRCRLWGFRLLARTADLGDIDSLPLDQLEAALARLQLRDVPGLFWSAYGWGGWINLSKDSPDAIAGLSKVAAMMRRVQALAPGYYHDGPDLFLGSYYASLPKMFGGDPEKSRQYFEAAQHSDDGHFLLAKTLCSQYYAVAVQNADLFKRLNEQVIESQDASPELRLANAVAKLKSKRLLERMNELF